MVQAGERSLGVLPGRAYGEHHELVPAYPRDDVRLAVGGTKYARYLDQGRVPFLVAPGVVNLLHAVDVGVEHGEALVLPLRHLAQLLREGEEPAPVVQARKLVCERLGTQLL